MRISDWSSDVCSSDLLLLVAFLRVHTFAHALLSLAARPCYRVGHQTPRRRAGPALSGCVLGLGRIASELATLRFETRLLDLPQHAIDIEIGRASCRERVCKYV